jgi:hypothetical protein
MRFLNKKYTLLGMMMLLPFWLMAQKIQTSVSKKNFGIDERISVTYEVEGKTSDLKIDNFHHFRAIQGPMRGTNMSIINGAYSSKTTLQYVVQAQKKGKIQIPTASAKIDGKLVKSERIIVNVGGISEETKSLNQQIKERVFIKTLISNRKPYLGESFQVTYKLYSRYNLSLNDFSQRPTFKGFWTQNFIKKLSRKVETLDGVKYYVVTLGQYLVVPQEVGNLTVEPFTTDLQIGIPTGRRDFFGNTEETPHNYKCSSGRLNINVQALPMGQPKNFSGAVGEFKINHSLSKDSVNTNETISFVQTLKGKGNMKLFKLPKISFPSDIEAFDPKNNDKISVNMGGMKGQKENQYILIPHNPGTYKLKVEGFSYFSPKKKQYISIGEQIFNIKVGGQASATSSGNVSHQNKSNGGLNSVNKQEVNILGEGILYIKENTSFETPKSKFFGTTLFWILLDLPFILALIFYILYKKIKNRTIDEVGQRNKKAKSVAKKRLSKAQEALKNNDSATYYQVLLDSVYGYFQDKFNLNASETNNDTIQEKLKESGIESMVIEDVHKVIETCLMANYGMLNEQEKAPLLEKATSIIEKIEDQL